MNLEVMSDCTNVELIIPMCWVLYVTFFLGSSDCTNISSIIQCVYKKTNTLLLVLIYETHKEDMRMCIQLHVVLLSLVHQSVIINILDSALPC